MFSFRILAAVGLITSLHLDVRADGDGTLPPANSFSPIVTEYASEERSQAAIGHYSKARALLIEAMREFEAGRQIARPDLLLNPDQWKSGVTAKADELTHVIAPQGRDTEGGVRFREHPSLLRKDLDKKPQQVASLKPRTPPTTSIKSKPKSKPITEKLVSVEKFHAETARGKLSEKKTEDLTPKLEVPKYEPVGTSLREMPAEDSAPKIDAKAVLSGDEEIPSQETVAAKGIDLENAVDPGLKKAMDGGPKTLSAESGGLDGQLASPQEVNEGMIREEQRASAPASLNDEEIRSRLKKLSEEIAQEEKGQ